MVCQRCGMEMEDGWSFCPRCGARKGADPAEVMGRDFFSQLLDSFRKTLEDGGSLDDAIAKGMRSFGTSPSDGSGKRRPFGPIKVEIRTKRMNPGQRRPGGRAPKVLDGNGRPHASDLPDSEAENRIKKEPEAFMKDDGGVRLIEVSLPGVSGPSDVYVRILESSIEVRAVAGDVMYFGIMSKPGGARVSGLSFSEGKLRIRL